MCGHLIKWNREPILDQKYPKKNRKGAGLVAQRAVQRRGMLTEAGTRDSSLEQSTRAASADTASEGNAQTSPMSTSRWGKLPGSQSIVGTF